jgi:hypothetical protein
MASNTLSVPVKVIEDALVAPLAVEHYAVIRNEYCTSALSEYVAGAAKDLLKQGLGRSIFVND